MRRSGRAAGPRLVACSLLVWVLLLAGCAREEPSRLPLSDYGPEQYRILSSQLAAVGPYDVYDLGAISWNDKSTTVAFSTCADRSEREKPSPSGWRATWITTIGPGERPRLLSHGDNKDLAPQWLHDGRHVVFKRRAPFQSDSGSPDQVNLVCIDMTTGRERVLIAGSPNARLTAYSCHPRQSRVAAVLLDAVTGNSRLVVLDATSGQLLLEALVPQVVLFNDLQWSPDGVHLATLGTVFARPEVTRELWCLNVRTLAWKRLAAGESLVLLAPSSESLLWSSGGKAVCFARESLLGAQDEAGQYRFCSVDLDGRESVLFGFLPPNGYVLAWWSWHPSGDCVALGLVGVRDDTAGQACIYLLGIAQSGQGFLRHLSLPGARWRRALWAPDGEQLLACPMRSSDGLAFLRMGTRATASESAPGPPAPGP